MLRKSRVPGWNWLLQRVSGLVLAVGLLGHFLVLHYTKMFGGRNIPVQDSTAARFLGSTKFWLLFDGLLLMSAVYHAFNGVYNIVLDYNPRSGVRKVLSWGLWIVGVVAFVVGFLLLGKFVEYARTSLMQWR